MSSFPPTALGLSLGLRSGRRRRRHRCRCSGAAALLLSRRRRDAAIPHQLRKVVGGQVEPRAAVCVCAGHVTASWFPAGVAFGIVPCRWCIPCGAVSAAAFSAATRVAVTALKPGPLYHVGPLRQRVRVLALVQRVQVVQLPQLLPYARDPRVAVGAVTGLSLVSCARRRRARIRLVAEALATHGARYLNHVHMLVDAGRLVANHVFEE
ncbi:hypothetical protein BKA81DRAFT_348471 [Phyllosticta paracitricarpa]